MVARISPDGEQFVPHGPWASQIVAGLRLMQIGISSAMTNDHESLPNEYVPGRFVEHNNARLFQFGRAAG